MTRLDGRFGLTLALALLIGCIVLAFSLGRFPIEAADLGHALVARVSGQPSGLSPAAESVIFQIRGPRVLAAVLIGSALATAGAAFQGLFRNPLVSPDILGASSGAALGAVLGIFFSGGGHARGRDQSRGRHDRDPEQRREVGERNRPERQGERSRAPEARKLVPRFILDPKDAAGVSHEALASRPLARPAWLAHEDRRASDLLESLGLQADGRLGLVPARVPLPTHTRCVAPAAGSCRPRRPARSPPRWLSAKEVFSSPSRPTCESGEASVREPSLLRDAGLRRPGGFTLIDLFPLIAGACRKPSSSRPKSVERRRESRQAHAPKRDGRRVPLTAGALDGSAGVVACRSRPEQHGVGLGREAGKSYAPPSWARRRPPRRPTSSRACATCRGLPPT